MFRIKRPLQVSPVHFSQCTMFCLNICVWTPLKPRTEFQQDTPNDDFAIEIVCHRMHINNFDSRVMRVGHPSRRRTNGGSSIVRCYLSTAEWKIFHQLDWFELRYLYATCQRINIHFSHRYFRMGGCFFLWLVYFTIAPLGMVVCLSQNVCPSRNVTRFDGVCHLCEWHRLPSSHHPFGINESNWFPCVPSSLMNDHFSGFYSLPCVRVRPCVLGHSYCCVKYMQCKGVTDLQAGE